MKKEELSKILAVSDRNEILNIAEVISQKHKVLILKQPEKTMVMLRVKESVKEEEFYLGELLACQSVVEVEGVQGASVQSGDDYKKVLAAAIIDAAHSASLEEYKKMEPKLVELSNLYQEKKRKEAAIHRDTQVKFRILEDNHADEA